MKIKITKCTPPKAWYKHEIGTKFKVKKESENMYLVQSSKHLDWWVLKDDCAVVTKTSKPKLKTVFIAAIVWIIVFLLIFYVISGLFDIFLNLN